jgi:NTP pyrophosphatase (non-canonical NTP hydrolase)
MDTKEYQKIIDETAIYPKEIGLAYCAMGLTGEAGEVSDKIKKLYRDDNIHDMLSADYGEFIQKNKKAIGKELGDVLWYVTAMANELGLSLEEIMEGNYNKLIKRRETNTLHGSGDNREEKEDSSCIKTIEGIFLCKGDTCWIYTIDDDIINPLTISEETFKNRPVHIFAHKENAYTFRHEINTPSEELTNYPVKKEKEKEKNKKRTAKL